MIHGVNKISKTRSLFFVLLVFLPGFLFLPNIGFAQIFQDIKSDSIEKHLELQGRDAQDLLMTLIQKFTDKKIDLETSGISSARERAVPCILRKAVRINVLNHLLKDAPIEITGKIIKTGLSIAKLFFAKDISVFIDEFEKQALKIAINKGMNFLFVQDIRISPGTMEFKYISQNKNEKEIVFQHIIIYKSLTPEKGKAQIRIYSPESIEPPKVEGSFGGMWGIYHEFEKDLSPFIVSIQGTVEKIGSSGFRWIDGPDISIDFPETVPDLGIKPLGFWEKHFFKPIETEIKKIKIVITKITGESPEINENDILEFSDAVRSIWDKAKTFFSKYNPFEAGLVRILKLSTQTFSKPNLTEKSFENKDDSKQEEQNEDYSINNNQIFLTQLSDIQEQLDDIAEHIDVLAQKKIKQSDRISENLSESVNKKNFDKQKNRKTDNKEIDKTDEDKLNQEQEELEQEQIIEKAVSRAAIICERNLSNRAARNKIIFNEIAWMGSLNSFNDEWIELKNISNKEVSLAGWQLLDKNRDIEIIFDEQDFIPVNGFFLLERTDDDSVPNIKADKIYTGWLSNQNESLRLFDQNCNLIDEILAVPDWLAGDNLEKQTMERYQDLTWHNYCGCELNGILGSPKQENSFFEQQDQGEQEQSQDKEQDQDNPAQQSMISEDITPPIVNFTTVSHIQDSLNFSVLWSARDVSSTISSMDGVLFTASPSGIDGFYVQYIVTPVLEGITPILNGLKYLEQGEWVAWLENKIIKIKDTILYLIGIDEQSYDFQIQALDNAGNKSEWIDGPCVNISVPKPILDIDQEVVEFTAIEFGLNPEEQILVISNLGSAVLEWEAVTSCDAEWIKMDLISGQILQGSKTEISLSADISDKKFGKYSAKIIIFSEYQEKEISVILDLEKDVISPETYLDTKFLPKNPCNSAQAMFYFNSDEDAGFECQLDDQDWWDCGSGEQGFSDLRQGWHKFNVRAIDKAGNIDLSPASYSWLIDTSPGTVVFSLFPFQTEPCFDFSFEMFDQGVSPSGLDGFYFREKRGNSEWQEQEYKKIPDSRYSFLEQRKFIGEDKQTYYFQVKIKDKAGNISEWLPELPAMTEISIPDSIKINQIKIADSEYIELYNPLDKDIDLSGFYLSYFSMNKDCEKDIENCLQWNEPSRNWQFTDKEFIASKEFYLIQVSGDKHDISIIPDWRIKKYDGTIYQSSQLSNTSGAIVVFSSNPEQEICSESAQQNYIDAFAWGKTQIVKETDPFSDFSLNDVKNKVFSRRQNAWDTNNNSLDFILKSENFHNSKRLSVWINDYPNQLNYVSKHPDFILRWFSIDPEVKYYEVDYKAEKDEQWQEFYQGADRQKEFISRRDYINYSFRIRAITEKNDISKQKQADVYIASLPITINEVMYYPETNDNYCEYVELYNNTDKDIDLNGWKLRVKKWKKYYDLELVIDTENSGISSIIKPGGFAIIGDEPDKDKHIYNKDLCQYQIPDYSEQVIRLKVKNENLSLINSGQGFISLKNVQDEIIDDFCYSSYWGAKRNGKSFQKLKPTHFSNLRYNWDQALPSPGKQNTNFDQNSLNYLIYWHNILSDYYIFSQKSGPYSIKSSFTVPVDKNLIIEPGVVIKFDNNNMSRISVYGNLFVQGEQENPVVFTSFSDDEYAGDTNKNGDLTLPKPGQWDGIRFEADSAGILENAIIRYGSSSTSWSGFCGRNSGRAMVRIEQADVSFNNVIIEKAKCKGLEIIDSDIVIENSVFRDFVKTNKTKPVAVLLQSGAITIKKSVFKNNYQGFYNLSRDKIIFENNIFRNNNQSAYIGLTDFYPLDNIMEDNDINGFEISGGLFKDLILRRDDNVPYVVINDILIPDGFLLEIQPGVIIKFKKSNDSCYKHSINVYGILLAQADSDNMIVFTSSSDSDFGGQTDKNFTIAKPGDWESIRFFNTGSILDNVMIRYGGLGGWSTAAGHIVREPAVVVESGDIVIRNSVIENNRMTGLEINDSVAVLENTIFRNHTGTYYRTYPNKALTIKNSEMSFIDCYFENNVYDVYWPYSKGECDLLSSSGNLSFDADGPSIECLARSLLE